MSESNLPGAQPVKQRSPSYSTFLPFLIVLLTLIFGSIKEIITLLKCKAAVRQEEVQAAAYLTEAGKQAVFMDSLRRDLRKLSSTDTVAAQVLSDFSPPSAPQNGEPSNSH